MKRVRDAGTVNWGVESDHRAIFLRLDIGESQRHYPEKLTMRADRTLLQNFGEEKKSGRRQYVNTLRFLPALA